MLVRSHLKPSSKLSFLLVVVVCGLKAFRIPKNYDDMSLLVYINNRVLPTPSVSDSA